MADTTFDDQAQSQMAPGTFNLTEAQKEELRNAISDLLLSFESDKNLVYLFLESPYRYLQEYHPVSILADMETKMPSLVFHFDQSIKRLKLELLSLGGNCLSCILAALVVIYAALLHFGLGADLLKSVVAEVLLALADFFKLDDKVQFVLELVVQFTVSVTPLALARNFCRRMGLCKKVLTVIDVDTIHSVLEKKKSPEENWYEMNKKGSSFDL